MTPSKLTGYSLALLASLLWGVSGTLAQFLFQRRGISPEWLVSVRLLVAGSLLLIYPLVKNPRSVLAPWKEKRDSLELLGFSVFGMLAVQYTYFAAIELSNAATATILQYLGPVFIAVYYSVREKRLPVPKEAAAIAFALLGTLLIVTHGSFENLSLSPPALFWGICSAVALAIYSILPIRLVNKHEASVIVGWGMLTGGVIFSFFHSPWKVPGVWDLQSWIFAVSIIIFGTAVAFYSFLVSVRIIGAGTASLLACVEPLVAAFIAVLWLEVPFGVYDWIGTICILVTIGILTRKEVEIG